MGQWLRIDFFGGCERNFCNCQMLKKYSQSQFSLSQLWKFNYHVHNNLRYFINVQSEHENRGKIFTSHEKRKFLIFFSSLFLIQIWYFILQKYILMTWIQIPDILKCWMGLKIFVKLKKFCWFEVKKLGKF